VVTNSSWIELLNPFSIIFVDEGNQSLIINTQNLQFPNTGINLISFEIYVRYVNSLFKSSGM
jgi:hypothetical protein